MSYLSIVVVAFVLFLIAGIVLNELDTDRKDGSEPISIFFGSIVLAMLWPLILASAALAAGAFLLYWPLLKLVRLVLKICHTHGKPA